MRKFATAIILSLLSTTAAHAASTGFPFVICGVKRCVTTENPAITQMPTSWSTFVPTAPASPPQPYYWVGFGAPPQETPMKGYYIPGPSRLRVPGGSKTLASWVKLTAAEKAAFHAVTRHLSPYPRPTALTSAVVDHSSADRPSSYLKLLTIGAPTRARISPDQWLGITLIGDKPSPWTDGLTQLAVSRHGSYLEREGKVYVIPSTVAARARAAKSLR